MARYASQRQYSEDDDDFKDDNRSYGDRSSGGRTYSSSGRITGNRFSEEDRFGSYGGASESSRIAISNRDYDDEMFYGRSGMEGRRGFNESGYYGRRNTGDDDYGRRYGRNYENDYMSGGNYNEDYHGSSGSRYGRGRNYGNQDYYRGSSSRSDYSGSGSGRPQENYGSRYNREDEDYSRGHGQRNFSYGTTYDDDERESRSFRRRPSRDY